jgi:hypothetical protein
MISSAVMFGKDGDMGSVSNLHRWLLLVMTSLVNAWGAIAQSETSGVEAEIRAFETVPKSEQDDAARKLSPPARSAIAERLRKARPFPEELNQWRTSGVDWTLLLALGDEAAGEYLVKALKKREERELVIELTRWRSPRAVEELAGFSFRDEAPTENTMFPPLSFEAARRLYVLIRNVDDFDESVRLWAASVRYEADEEGRRRLKDSEGRHDPARAAAEENRALLRQREIIRNWWKANEGFFASKEYGKVRPGERYSQASLSGMARVPGPVESFQPNTALAPNLTPPANPSASSPNPTGSENLEIWLWMGGAVVIAGTVAMGVSRKVRGRK